MMSLRRKATILTRQAIVNSHSWHISNANVPKSSRIQSYLYPSSSCEAKIQRPFSFFSYHQATQRIYRSVNSGIIENSNKKVGVHVISKENIKPASPTPSRLRTLNLSVIDQVVYAQYTPLILFIPNTGNICLTDVITKRSSVLKESLSKLLTEYYPFAGEIKSDSHIECNDKGVYFVEAQIDQTLREFLHQPDDQKVRELIPKHPSTTEFSLGNYITSVQVNVFSCGGIGLSTSLTHKIVDGHSYFTFMKAWAAAARGSSEIVNKPIFVASELFPYCPSLKYSLPSKFNTTKALTTKRFVFDSTSLALLKSKLVCYTSPPARGPSRMEVTTTLVWKAAAKAASTVRPFNAQSPHALFSLVNLRGRAIPPLPKESMGNLFDAAVAICFPQKQPDLSTLLVEVRESIANINANHIESLKGEKGYKMYEMLLKKLNELSNVVDEGDCLFVTSLLNSGMYDLDFGWGKPIWFYHMNPGCSRLLCLNDTIKGGGVEAIVTLSSEEMEIFEQDPGILSHAIVNPSPLQFLE